MKKLSSAEEGFRHCVTAWVEFQLRTQIGAGEAVTG